MKQKIIFNLIDNKGNPDDRNIASLEELVEIVSFLKGEGKTIGYTAGVFDIIHIGHLLYLEKAKELVDFLVVGIDSDELVKSRKGDSRPVVKLDERISILVRCRSVDLVLVRNLGDDEYCHVKEIRPDIMVVSETTKDREGFIEDLKKGYDGFVGTIVALPAQSTTSTTARVRVLAIDGAKDLSNKILGVIDEHFKSV